MIFKWRGTDIVYLLNILHIILTIIIYNNHIYLTRT